MISNQQARRRRETNRIIKEERTRGRKRKRDRPSLIHHAHTRTKERGGKKKRL